MIDFSKQITDDGIQLVRVAGDLLGGSNQYFFDCIQDEIETGQKHIVISFADIGYVNSAGLGSLVRARARVSSLGGTVYLAQIENKLIDLFSILNFDKIFNIFPTECEAVEAIRKRVYC
ncbi:MAG: STAS domain-containing protein [Planctomycetota bacterium]